MTADCLDRSAFDCLMRNRATLIEEFQYTSYLKHVVELRLTFHFVAGYRYFVIHRVANRHVLR